ncbi:MAG: hypothetical protein ACRER5_02900 [Pseudomonas sp.]
MKYPAWKEHLNALAQHDPVRVEANVHERAQSLGATAAANAKLDRLAFGGMAVVGLSIIAVAILLASVYPGAILVIAAIVGLALLVTGVDQFPYRTGIGQTARDEYIREQLCELPPYKLEEVSKACESIPELQPIIASWVGQLGYLRTIEYDLIKETTAIHRKATQYDRWAPKSVAQTWADEANEALLEESNLRALERLTKHCSSGGDVGS